VQSNINKYNPKFCGLTKIYAIADSHQETRKTSALLSKVLDDTGMDKNILFLNCGDIFKGIYPRQLERDCYIKMKEANPDIEMVMTLGNNDFGFNMDSLEYLIDTIKRFSKKGIKTVCANIFNSEGKRPDWLSPYSIVERDGDRTFVTGFCIDNINTSKFGIIPKKQFEVLQEIISAIKTERPDNVVVLNHDYMPVSRKIVDECQKQGVKIDVVIGGHDHEFVPPDTDLNIYYPKAFSDSMYKMYLRRNNGVSSVSDVEMIDNSGLRVDEIFAKDLQKYERETGLMDKIVPYTLNLPKWYSKPSPLGSFLADEMKNISGSDIAFFSTGFLMKPMLYQDGQYITKYLFKKTIIADTPIRVVELSADELRDVFQHSLKTNGYGNSNPKFLQCSNNVRIEGSNDAENKKWILKQIYIDDEPLFDSSLKPLNSVKKYSCAIDSYIAEGGQGFNLRDIKKDYVYEDNQPVKINDVLLNGLIKAENIYPKGYTYPQFKLIEV
jgi:2',3'-cyclic-nucleotide 2'-phosphodiesterase (5'-nucleotidase family)